MNERFLFRGKRKDNGEWVTGYLIQGNKTYIATTEAINYMVVSTSYMASIKLVEVIPETVGQYTGLKDKNGKLIFEEDIIKTKEYGRDIGHSNVNNFDIFKVIYEPAVFRLENVRRGFNLVGNGNDFEIIGNIHDNPELLEVER